MTSKAFRPWALSFAVSAVVVAAGPPAEAQTTAQTQLMQACGGGLAACASATRQAATKGGGVGGLSAFLNAAAAAVSAAAGQTVTPTASVPAPVGTSTNAAAAITAQQQYAQCVQNAGQNAVIASACVHMLPPEWAAMARAAQQGVVNNPGLAQQAAQVQGAAASNLYGASAYNPGAGDSAAAIAAQAAYVSCIQSAGLNIAAAAACGQPVQNAYGGHLGVAPPGYNPVTSANAIAGAAGGYHACVMSVGAANAAAVRSCQQRFLGR